MDFQHKDFVKAAKDLNKKAGTSIKVVAVKGDVLRKDIVDTVKRTTFDWSQLEETTLDVFDSLGCGVPEEFEVLSETVDGEIQEDFVDEEEMEPEEIEEEENTDSEVEEPDYQHPEALTLAADDISDVLGYDKEAIERFKKLDVKGMIKELTSMAAEINMPYEEAGKTVTPDDKPEDFKLETIECLNANNIPVKWAEKPKPELKVVKKEKPAEKKQDEKPKAKDKKKEKASKAKSRYGHQNGSMSAVIDDLVWKGMTIGSMVKELIKQFPDRDEKKAISKINIHLNHLQKTKKVDILTSEKGVIKSKQEVI